MKKHQKNKAILRTISNRRSAGGCISLREYLAGQALNGLAVNDTGKPYEYEVGGQKVSAAVKAVAMADGAVEALG